MQRRILASLFLILVLATCALAREVKNPDTLIYMSYGTLNSMDPAFVYDTDSGGVIMQVYENLFMWPTGTVDGNEKDLSYSLAISDLQPMLAEAVPTADNGLLVEFPDGRIQYTIPIRTGLHFHEGGTLTAEDVEYTFERGILQDRSGGPQWMYYESLSGFRYWGLHQLARDVLGNPDIGRGNIGSLSAEDQAKIYDVIDKWVEVSPDGRSVIFTLNAPYPPFLSILAHGAAWSAILDKEWVIEQGGWDGQADTWAAHYNPGGGTAAEASELYSVTNGTGPYRLVRWDPGVERVYERFDGYWREPAPIERVVHRQVQEWTDRYLAFENMDADIVVVDPQYVPQVEVLDGVVVHRDLPRISMNPTIIYGSDLVVEGNDLVGDGQWGEDGIDSTFLNDVHVRRAFAYCFDQQFFIDEAYGSVGGFRAHGPIPRAFEWAYNPDPALLIDLDLETAEQEFRAAHGGRVWDEGFTFTLVYNEGNDARRAMAEMREYNVEPLNPKFHVEILGMPWSSMLDQLITNKMPMTLVGWLMDYPDPHNFAQPFCQSNGGGYAEFQGDTIRGIYAEFIDPLILEAMQTTDQARRAELYFEISRLTVEYATYLWMPQVNGYRVSRDYIQGWAFNPAFSDPYFYSIHKTYTEDF